MHTYLPEQMKRDETACKFSLSWGGRMDKGDGGRETKRFRASLDDLPSPPVKRISTTNVSLISRQAVTRVFTKDDLVNNEPPTCRS